MPPRGKCLSAAASSGTLVQRTHLFVRTHKCVVFPSVRAACGSCWAHAWFMLCLYYTRAQSSGFEKEIKLQHFHCFIVRAGQISPTRHPMRRGLRRRPLGKEAPLCAPLDAYVAFAAFSHRSAKSHGRVGFSLFVQAFVCAGNNGICVQRTHLFVRTHKCVVFPSVRTACGSCWAHAWFMLCLCYTRAQKFRL